MPRTFSAFTLPSWATNTVGNASEVGFGVIDDRDGHYNHGSYDEILRFELFTDSYFGWVTTAGWYTGPGAGQHFIGARTSYFVLAYRC